MIISLFHHHRKKLMKRYIFGIFFSVLALSGWYPTNQLSTSILSKILYSQTNSLGLNTLFLLDINGNEQNFAQLPAHNFIISPNKTKVASKLYLDNKYAIVILDSNGHINLNYELPNFHESNNWRILSWLNDETLLLSSESSENLVIYTLNTKGQIARLTRPPYIEAFLNTVFRPNIPYISAHFADDMRLSGLLDLSPSLRYVATPPIISAYPNQQSPDDILIWDLQNLQSPIAVIPDTYPWFTLASYDSKAAWSPYSDALAYIKFTDEGQALHIMNFDTLQTEFIGLVCPRDVYCLIKNLSWYSEDQIVLSIDLADESQSEQIIVVNLTEKTWHNIYKSQNDLSWFDISPDRQYIAIAEAELNNNSEHFITLRVLNLPTMEQEMIKTWVVSQYPTIRFVGWLVGRDT